ncbi:LPXTG cell wall anchor domain-containing protein [Nocardiopsis oceani]
MHEGEYLYSLWHDGELVIDEEQGEANTTTEGLDPAKGELRAKMTYESVNNEGHNLVFDETHDYEAPEDCPPADEAECVTVVECVEALLDDGIITTGAEVYVVVNGVYYLCTVDAGGEVAYEEVTEDDATSDDSGEVYRIDAYGVWWCILDGSWEQVTEVVATTGDESGKGEGEKDEEADGNGGDTGTADANPVSSGSDSLPVTGAALAGLVAAGLTALGGGGVALYLARRRKAAVDNGGVDDE